MTGHPGPDPGTSYIMENMSHVYIMASKHNGTLYIGATSNLSQRTSQHKGGKITGFSKKYSVNKLVYYEGCGTLAQAMKRERQLKNWKRSWKIELVEKLNPNWDDLYTKIQKNNVEGS